MTPHKYRHTRKMEPYHVLEDRVRHFEGDANNYQS